MPKGIHAFGSFHALTNRITLHQTAASLIYDTHWRNLNLIERWDWDRFARLSAFLKHTPYELGSLVMMKHTAVDVLKQFNHLRGHNAQVTALILTLLEAHLMSAWKKDVILNPFPSLVVTPSAE